MMIRRDSSAAMHIVLVALGLFSSSLVSTALVLPIQQGQRNFVATRTRQPQWLVVPSYTSTVEELRQATTRQGPLLLYSSPNNSDSSSNTAVEEVLDFDNFLLDKNTVPGVTRLAQVLNDATGGWALSFADLRPETETSLAGMGFLATNLGYGLAGLLLAFQGDFVYGVLTDLAALVSFWYHYTQLKFGPDRPAIVRLALLLDYVVASATILTTVVYVSTGHTMENIPFEGIVAGALGTVSLGLCWVWEYGYPYIVLHSLWHLLSAYAGYIVGTAHLATTGGSIWQ